MYNMYSHCNKDFQASQKFHTCCFFVLTTGFSLQKIRTNTFLYKLKPLARCNAKIAKLVLMDRILFWRVVMHRLYPPILIQNGSKTCPSTCGTNEKPKISSTIIWCSSRGQSKGWSYNHPLISIKFFFKQRLDILGLPTNVFSLVLYKTRQTNFFRKMFPDCLWANTDKNGFRNLSMYKLWVICPPFS